MGVVKTYDPKQVSVIIGGKIMSGFADGSIVKVKRNSDAFTLKVGVDGGGTRAKSNDSSGEIEIELMQSSNSNDDLSAFAQADALTNAGVVSGIVKDGSGRTVVGATTCWVKKMPDVSFGKEVGTRTWVIVSDDLNMFVGGN